MPPILLFSWKDNFMGVVTRCVFISYKVLLFRQVFFLFGASFCSASGALMLLYGQIVTGRNKDRIFFAIKITKSKELNSEETVMAPERMRGSEFSQLDLKTETSFLSISSFSMHLLWKLQIKSVFPGDLQKLHLV